MGEGPCQILILTGPPGSGKTTTARSLASRFDRPAVHLHTDDFWGYIRKGAIPPYLPAARRQNEVVMDVVAGAAQAYASGGYFVVVDGIVGPWLLDPFRRLPARLDYVVLRPSLDEAIARCCERGGDTLTDPEPIADLYDQLSALGDLESHVVGISGLDPEATLEAVLRALGSGRCRLR